MDDVEQLAETIFKSNPFTVEGEILDWAEVVSNHPGKATEYREAARNRIRAEEAMKRLAEPRGGLALNG